YASSIGLNIPTRLQDCSSVVVSKVHALFVSLYSTCVREEVRLKNAHKVSQLSRDSCRRLPVFFWLKSGSFGRVLTPVFLRSLSHEALRSLQIASDPAEIVVTAAGP